MPLSGCCAHLWQNSMYSSSRNVSEPPMMLDLGYFLHVLLPVLTVVSAAGSGPMPSSRFIVSLRSRCLPCATSQPYPSLPLSPYWATNAASIYSGISQLSLANFASAPSLAKCHCVCPSCLASVPLGRPWQMTYLLIGVTELLYRPKPFSLWRRTHPQHVRDRSSGWFLPTRSATEYVSVFLTTSSHPNRTKLTGLSHVTRIPAERNSTAAREAACDSGRVKELGREYERMKTQCRNADAEWKQAAFLPGSHTTASCISPVHQKEASASAANMLALRRSREASTAVQSKPLLVAADIFDLLERRPPHLPKDLVLSRAMSTFIQRDGSPTCAWGTCTPANGGHSVIRGSFPHMSNCGQTRSAVGRKLPFCPYQTQWMVLPNVERAQSPRTPGRGTTQNVPTESVVDADSVKNAEKEYVVGNPHQASGVQGDVEHAGTSLKTLAQHHVEPPDMVLSGKKRGRLTVTLSNNHVHACVVDNRMQRTYAYANSFDKCLLPVIGFTQRRRGLRPRPHGGTMKAAWEVGRLVARRALAKGIKKVFFDRKGYRYIGRVKALADGARNGGLEF